MPEQLETGTYKPSDEIEVIYWKAPDKDGDGDEVWEDRFDNNGNSLGRHSVKDQNDNQVFHYEPPDGFTNRPGYDHADNYVLTDNRGRVMRDAAGEAINIRPGTARVLYPDGRSEVLADEYSRHVFALAHSKIADDVDLTDKNDDDDDDDVKVPVKKAVPAKKAATPAQGGNN